MGQFKNHGPLVMVRTQRKTQAKVQRRVKNTRDKVHEGAPYIRCSGGYVCLSGEPGVGPDPYSP